MRKLALALTPVFLICACSEEPAPTGAETTATTTRSTDGPGWTAPDGRFSVTFPPDWKVLEAAGRPPQILAQFAPATPAGKECFVETRPLPTPARGGQAVLNAQVARWSDKELLGNLGSADTAAEVLSSDNTDIDGVRVASAVVALEAPDHGPRFHTRQFVVAGFESPFTFGGEDEMAEYYAVHCYLAAPTPENEAEVETLLASLRF